MSFQVQFPFLTNASKGRNTAATMNDTHPFLSVLKDNLHQCWLHVYGPVFWIVSALCCAWESHHREKHRVAMEKAMYTTTDDDEEDHQPSWDSTSTYSESFHSHRPAAASPATSSSVSLQTMSDHEIMVSDAPPLPKKPFRRALLQSLKKKQHSINAAIKRPFARKNTNKTASSPPDIPTTTTSSGFRFRRHRLSQEAGEGRRLSMSESLFKSLSLNKTPKQQPTRSALDTWDPPSSPRSLDDASSHLYHPLDPHGSAPKRPTKLSKSRVYAESSSFIPFRRKTAPELEWNRPLNRET